MKGHVRCPTAPEGREGGVLCVASKGRDDFLENRELAALHVYLVLLLKIKN